MSEDHPRRPHDHHVEPLFAGLGLEEHVPPRPGRRGRLVLPVLLALVASTALLWWLA